MKVRLRIKSARNEKVIQSWLERLGHEVVHNGSEEARPDVWIHECEKRSELVLESASGEVLRKTLKLPTGIKTLGQGLLAFARELELSRTQVAFLLSATGESTAAQEDAWRRCLSHARTQWTQPVFYHSLAELEGAWQSSTARPACVFLAGHQHAEPLTEWTMRPLARTKIRTRSPS